MTSIYCQEIINTIDRLQQFIYSQSSKTTLSSSIQDLKEALDCVHVLRKDIHDSNCVDYLEHLEPGLDLIQILDGIEYKINLELQQLKLPSFSPNLSRQNGYYKNI